MDNEEVAAKGHRQPDLARMSSAELLPIVYEELRRLAAARLAREGHAEAMQPTSLVHAVYVRLVGQAARDERAWDSRAHFFGAAAIAMRRILVERARMRNQGKRGGGWKRVDATDLSENADSDSVDMVALDSALSQLEAYDESMYRIVMLRYFAGLSIDHTARLVGVSPVTVKRHWNVARLWLLERIDAGDGGGAPAPTS